MSLAQHLLAWRVAKGITQEALALSAGLTRAYISRIESGKADPSLSSTRMIATALGIRVGALIDELPPERPLDRDALDHLARAAIWPSLGRSVQPAGARTLSNLIRERRRAVGLFRPRLKNPKRRHPPRSDHAERRLHAALGDKQWSAVLRRIDKLLSLQAGAFGHRQ